MYGFEKIANITDIEKLYVQHLSPTQCNDGLRLVFVSSKITLRYESVLQMPMNAYRHVYVCLFLA